MTDYYAILGISRSQAEIADVATAYRRAALAYNPDCNPNADDKKELRRRFTLVSQAYVVLSDAKRRAVYDQYGMEGVKHGGTGTGGVPGGLNIDAIDPDAVFRDFFGVDNPFQIIGGSSGVESSQHKFYSMSAAEVKGAKPAAIETTLEATLEDIYHGSIRTVTWAPAVESASPSQQQQQAAASSNNNKCEIHIPRGAADGSTYCLAEKGTALPGCHKGDVLVTLRTVPHPTLRRRPSQRPGAKGDDLVVTVPITLAEALTGVAREVKTLDGRTLQVMIDEVVHPAFQKRIVGEGLPLYSATPTTAGVDESRESNGDLIVECSTTFPKYLSSEQKGELRRVLGEKA